MKYDLDLDDYSETASDAASEDDLDDWSATQSLSTSISHSVASSINVPSAAGAGGFPERGKTHPERGYLGGSNARDVSGGAALYRNEIANPDQASAIARAGALLRRTMQASEGLVAQFDALASGTAREPSGVSSDNPPISGNKGGAAASTKAVSTLEAELELVNKRLAHLRKIQSSAGAAQASVGSTTGTSRAFPSLGVANQGIAGAQGGTDVMEDKSLRSMASSATQFVSDDEDHFATHIVPVPSGGSEFGLAERGGGGVGRGGQKNDVFPSQGRHGRAGTQGMTTSKPSAHVQDEIMQSGGAWAKHEKQKQAMRKEQQEERHAALQASQKHEQDRQLARLPKHLEADAGDGLKWKDSQNVGEQPLEIVLAENLQRTRQDLKEQQRANVALQANMKELLAQVKKRDETIQHLFALVSERDFTIAMLKQSPSNGATITQVQSANMLRHGSRDADDTTGQASQNKSKNKKADMLATTETVVNEPGRAAGASIRFAEDTKSTARGVSRASTSIMGMATQSPETVQDGSYETLVLLDRDANLRYSITSFDQPFLIGRSSSCNLVCDHKIHPSVSRAHAKIYYDSASGKWDIQDSSSSGTAVNDDGFQGEVFKELQVGDVITVGGVATGKQLLVESISRFPTA